jgi:membrane protein implicated in regulation of membrane protease activity
MVCIIPHIHNPAYVFPYMKMTLMTLKVKIAVMRRYNSNAMLLHGVLLLLQLLLLLLQLLLLLLQLLLLLLQLLLLLLQLLLLQLGTVAYGTHAVLSPVGGVVHEDECEEEKRGRQERTEKEGERLKKISPMRAGTQAQRIFSVHA